MAKKERDEEIKLNDAWEWLKYYESQRTRFYYAFLIIMSLFGFVTFQISEHLAASWLIPSLSMVGIIISLSFIFLDLRNTELENRGLTELKRFGFDPAEESQEDYQEAVHSLKGEPEKTKPRWIREGQFLKPLISHTLWYRTIYIMGFSISCVMFIYFSSLEKAWFFLLAYFFFLTTFSFLKWRRR